MRDAKLIATTEIDVDDIRIENRMRPTSDVAITSLIASIKEIGLQQEIHVRKSRHRKGHLYLISGGHRIEAFRQMKRQKIPCKVWDCTDDWAKLAEIDDNLAHAELAPLDLAVFLANRKTIYERMYPETKNGGNRGNQHTGGRQNDNLSFCQSVSAQRDMSARNVERLVAAGQGLDQKAIALLRAAPRRVTLVDLQVIAKAEPDARPIICRELSRGKAKSAKEVLDRRKHPGAKVASPSDLELRKLDDAWARASKAAKRRFVVAHADDLRDLLSDDHAAGPDTGEVAFGSRRAL